MCSSSFPDVAKPKHVRLLFFLTLSLYVSSSVAFTWYSEYILIVRINFGIIYYIMMTFAILLRKHELLIVGAFAIFKTLFSSFMFCVSIYYLWHGEYLTGTAKRWLPKSGFLALENLGSVAICALSLYYGYVAYFFYHYHAHLKKVEKDAILEVYESIRRQQYQQTTAQPKEENGSGDAYP
ncbi:hypothetical protein QR680_008023 [Steinernema hermaphroditum]|uniref:Uncharacterized protein n=1 Tax=Steinernema hermaphroditum TaxID=289476 RepID=A0AA39IF20_9BILA|nr:hypothetical protein QR680_008023 [Steinernema hermaphroditum]